MSLPAPLNIVVAFRNAGINLGMADGKLICWITPKSARRLMTPVHLAVAADLEAGFDDEETETEVSLEQVVAEVAALENA
jgi:hypothetical protein